MNASKLTISIVLACAYLGGCASADTPAPAPDATVAAPSGQDKAFLEENPEKLKAFSCETLDDAMARNYGLACTMELAQNAIDKAIGDQSVRQFKAQHKEYKSRCKGKPAKLAEAKRGRSGRPCKSLP